jgi:hypothetical protein
MRRVGSLDRIITIQRVTGGDINDFGAVSKTWEDLVTLRAKKIQGAATDETHSGVAVTDTKIKFQTYYFDGLTLEDRIQFEGDTYTLIYISEIGRRRGLELHVDKLGA